MIYTQLFPQLDSSRMVRAGVIGTGHFATAIVTQSRSMPWLDVSVVADLDVEAAGRAYRRAGLDDEAIAVCDSRHAVLQALGRGKRVIVEDALLLMELPLDVIVESTGVPEAGAHHALAAIHSGKHVAMVNKEADVVVGPILKQMADAAGVVYTAVDGDQHGLLIALVTWAQALGLEILCAGKARDAEFVHDVYDETVSCSGQTIGLEGDEGRWLDPIPPQRTDEFVTARRELLSSLPQVGGYDLTEMAIVTNATGLHPDVDTLHCPALHTAEIPEVLCPLEEGGILSQRGVVDAVTCLRHPHEAGLGGGVFVVVACANDYSRHILTTKGLIPNSRESAALIYRPYHLCGVETPMSLLYAGLLDRPTAADDYHPHVDVVARTTRDLAAGEVLGDDHSPDLQALIRPAQALSQDLALPLHVGRGNRLAVDVPAGTVITAEMVVPPEESVLWTLRMQQDRHFLAE